MCLGTDIVAKSLRSIDGTDVCRLAPCPSEAKCTDGKTDHGGQGEHNAGCSALVPVLQRAFSSSWQVHQDEGLAARGHSAVTPGAPPLPGMHFPGSCS